MIKSNDTALIPETHGKIIENPIRSFEPLYQQDQVGEHHLVKFADGVTIRIDNTNQSYATCLAVYIRLRERSLHFKGDYCPRIIKNQRRIK